MAVSWASECIRFATSSTCQRNRCNRTLRIHYFYKFTINLKKTEWVYVNGNNTHKLLYVSHIERA